MLETKPKKKKRKFLNLKMRTRNTTRGSEKNREISKMPTPFECRVGGIIYHTTVEILSSVPESYFKVALSATWIPVGQTFLKIDRDGIHFQYILDFLRYGNLPRDSAGRCQIPKEILESLSVDADFYGLPVLVKEIEQLLKYDLKGMRYFISEFFLNSGASGGLSLKEFTSYEQAYKIYENYKNSCIQGLGRHVDNDDISGDISMEKPRTTMMTKKGIKILL
jgi:hypothetical protein